MSLAQISDLSTTETHSDTYRAAFQFALEAMQNGGIPLSLATLSRLDQLANSLPAIISDSTESLLDDRRICRRAIIDASRRAMREEIDRVMAALDDVRQRAADDTIYVDPILLDEATCAALNACVSVSDQPFRTTMRHLDTARAILNNLLLPGRRLTSN